MTKEVFRIKADGLYELWVCGHTSSGWCLPCAEKVCYSLLKGKFAPRIEVEE